MPRGRTLDFSSKLPSFLPISHFPPSGQGLVRFARCDFAFHRRITPFDSFRADRVQKKDSHSIGRRVRFLQHIMSSESPLPTPTQNVVLDTSSLPAATSSSVWDRISNWVSENKAVVYTIAGVAVVVTGAGVVYYLNDSSKSSASSTPSVPKKSKNQRRKEKKKAEEEKKTKAASVQEGSSPTTWL